MKQRGSRTSRGRARGPAIAAPIIGLTIALTAGCSGSGGTPTPSGTASGTATPSSAGGVRLPVITPSGSVTTGTPAPVGAAPAKGDQSAVLASLPGASGPACVSVGSTATVHAGNLAAGDFAQAQAAYAKTTATTKKPTVSLYIIPRHAKKMPGVKVTSTPTTQSAGSAKPVSVTSTDVEQADAWSYYAVQLPVSAPGTYRVTAVSGADRGCFMVTFSR